MSRELRYWDSNCFLAYFNEEEGRADRCEFILSEAEKGGILIVTSALTLAEVLALRGEKRLLPTENIKNKVVAFFKQEYISVQNVTRTVAELARDLVWDDRIKPKDAVHVASALLVEAPILETFDRPLIRKNGKVGNPGLIIREPPADPAPQFPFDAPEQARKTGRDG